MIAVYGAVCVPSCSANEPPKRSPRRRPVDDAAGQALGDALDVGEAVEDAAPAAHGHGEGAGHRAWAAKYHGSRSPATIRSAASAARPTSSATSPAPWRQRPST